MRWERVKSWSTIPWPGQNQHCSSSIRCMTMVYKMGGKVWISNPKGNLGRRLGKHIHAPTMPDTVISNLKYYRVRLHLILKGWSCSVTYIFQIQNFQNLALPIVNPTTNNNFNNIPSWVVEGWEGDLISHFIIFNCLYTVMHSVFSVVCPWKDSPVNCTYICTNYLLKKTKVQVKKGCPGSAGHGTVVSLIPIASKEMQGTGEDGTQHTKTLGIGSKGHHSPVQVLGLPWTCWMIRHPS